jgi:type I restriction enzyme M protein
MPKDEKSEKYISTADLARILGITRQAVLKTIKDREGVRVKEVGRSYMYEVDTLPQDIKKRLEDAQEEAAKTLQTLKPTNGKDLDFEKELWKAADRLRGNIDPSEYKHVVLGLLFLKYVSDAFYDRRRQLEKWTSDPQNKDYYIQREQDRKTVVDDRDQYKKEGIFYIPENARWDYLRAHVMHHDIGEYIDRAMEAIENENPMLKGVLPKIYTRTLLESHILGELVNIFSRIKFNHDIDREKDILGRVYEYFLGQFASAEGKRGGEFYTPRSIVRLLVEVVEPYENARIFDPACGSGGMFVQSVEHLRRRGKDFSRLSIQGQELNQVTWRLCQMNLAIRGIISGQIEQGNSYYTDKFPDLRADFVLANPPFNAEWEPERLSDKDPRIKYGTPPGSNANFLWIQHFIYHLAPNGMAGFVMANGALAVSGREGEIRKKIIENDLVDVIIACPAKLFYNVSLPVSLWFITKNKKNGRFRDRTGETLFIDARETFEQISRKQVTFTKEQIQKIAGTVRAWRGESGAGKYEDIAGFCKAVKKEEIAKNGYHLNPGMYVGVAEEEDDGVPFEEKMEKLTEELKHHFGEGRGLEDKIKENLNKFEHYG